MSKISTRMLAGGGQAADPKMLHTVADNIAGRTICAFGEACSWPTEAIISKFRDELTSHTRPELADTPKNPVTEKAMASL